MGVRTKTVKRASRAIIEKYYGKMTKDFHFNKRIIDDIAVIQSKRMRNKIAGYTTHLMKRIEKGPVRGISLKLQEEERWISSQRSPRSKSPTSNLTTKRSRILSETLVSRDLSTQTNHRELLIDERDTK